MIFYAVVLFKSFEAFDSPLHWHCSTLHLLLPDLLMHCITLANVNLRVPGLPGILNSVKLEGEVSKSISS